MYNFQEAEVLKKEKAGAGLRKVIEKTVDSIFEQGFKNVFYIGIGGTISHAFDVESFVQTNSTLPLYLANAGEYIKMGNKNLTKDSVVYVESRSGDTPEMVEAVDKCKGAGARVYGFIEKEDSPLAKSVDVLVSTATVGYYQPYYFFGYMMKKWGDFSDYDALADCLETLPEKIVKAYPVIDGYCRKFAETYGEADMNYLVGAGNSWGAAYCLAMCYMEEMMWMRTKSIHAAEFFHGTLEVIEKGVSVLLFKSEDDSRAEVQRAEDFIRRVTNDVTVYDSKDVELEGVPQELRRYLSPFIFHAYQERTFMNLEDIRKHPGDIRRYYRRLKY